MELIDRQALIDEVMKKAKRLKDNLDTCNGLAGAVAIAMELPTIEERKTMTHEEAVGFLQESGWLQDHDRQIYEQGKRDGKPVGKYTAVETKYDFVTTNRGAQRTSDIVLKILEKLYNDFTMRRDEERALDWAMDFIREHRKEGE